MYEYLTRLTSKLPPTACYGSLSFLLCIMRKGFVFDIDGYEASTIEPPLDSSEVGERPLSLLLAMISSCAFSSIVYRFCSSSGSISSTGTSSFEASRVGYAASSGLLLEMLLDKVRMLRWMSSYTFMGTNISSLSTSLLAKPKPNLNPISFLTGSTECANWNLL